MFEKIKDFIGSLFIPKGLYCYNGNHKKCIFRTDVEVYNQYTKKWIKLPFCNFLNLGDVGNDITEEEYNFVKEVLTPEILEKYFPLFLLWDSCKECGINMEFPDGE